MSKILVVEDSQDNYDLLADLLEEYGYELFHASNGLLALSEAERIMPDLILLDMGLPELDGWGVVRRLKSNSNLASIPVIALTAHAMKGDRERCMEAGCDRYMSKPIDTVKLTELLEHYLGSPRPCNVSGVTDNGVRADNLR